MFPELSLEMEREQSPYLWDGDEFRSWPLVRKFTESMRMQLNNVSDV